MPAIAKLKQMRPQMQPGQEDGEFVVFEHVCIFDEHESDDGIVYDKELLKCIAENCNRRIRDTGDWCPVVDLHTSEEGGRQEEPPVVGLAGPFYVGQFGNEQKRWAIFCTFWIFKDQEQVFRRRPRRSVEIWPEERPEDRYFDPIAILGAETPRRDLGLIYSKARSRGTKPIRYEAAAPGGGNTFIAGLEDKPTKNSKGMAMDGLLSPEQLNQITEALQPTLQQMVDEINLGAANIDAEPDLEPELGLEDDLAMDGELPGEEMPGDPLLDGARPEEGIDDYSRYMADGLKEFAGELGGEPDLEGASAYLGGLEDEDREGIDRYMKDDSDDEELQELYAKICDSGNMASQDMKQGNVEKYRRQRNVARQKYAKLRRNHAELRAKYSKLETQVVKIRKSERYAKRDGVLRELQAAGYILDRQEELEDTEDFTDSQFDNHVSRVKERYQKVPGGEMIPVDANTPPANGSQKMAESSKYAGQAEKLVQKYRKQRRKVNYQLVLKTLIESGGDESAVDSIVS